VAAAAAQCSSGVADVCVDADAGAPTAGTVSQPFAEAVTVVIADSQE
jgi:hypothetical protein